MGLPLQDRMSEKGITARCGLIVVDTETGETVQWLRIEGVVAELYDVSFCKALYDRPLLGLTAQRYNTRLRWRLTDRPH